METKFITVVYAVNDEAAFEGTRKEIMHSLSAFDVDNPPEFGVCAISMGDELRRLDMIGRALDSSNVPLAQKLVSVEKLPDDTGRNDEGMVFYA
ncbi:TPA: hypothetical protein RQL23_003955 [Vibrio vulnificus]|uniref:hypothetical protein n=1 Tax=Vibrio parahaemolyticus TaxID=670 RepID=UPI0028C1C166|nr:hypothetical protein [Vibrio parahaemolyticus]MEA5377328.1 hypothetical protein [Vibrio parahaemolyticus]HDY8182569.1 hypothetical protein [Vibrio vulnificus]HDZ9162587.1 hypothetical protein [Vibrio cholerae]